MRRGAVRSDLKLKVNVGKLRTQYQCKAVRLRVVTNDGKVTLKPVPIYG
jgi:hypothetical protein